MIERASRLLPPLLRRSSPRDIAARRCGRWQGGSRRNRHFIERYIIVELRAGSGSLGALGSRYCGGQPEGYAAQINKAEYI